MTGAVPDTVELQLPSQLRYLAVIDAVIHALGAEFGWGTDEMDSAGTSAIEAATNAIEHGNEFADTKIVQVRIRCDPSSIDIEVQDEGGGFDPSVLDREPRPEDLLKPRGRGIFIMRSFMDEVQFSRLPERGMLVRLRKVAKPTAPGRKSG